MPIARNQREVEKMIMEQVKKKIPGLTSEYCHKWYVEHEEMKGIVSEAKFIQIVKDSMQLTIKKGQVTTEFEIFKSEDITQEQYEKMKVLWEDFKGGYILAVMPKIFK